MESIKIQDTMYNKYGNSASVQDGFIYVLRQKDGKTRVLDQTGNELISEDYLLHNIYDSFVEGLAIVYNNAIFQGYGYMNPEGKIAIPCQFMEAHPFSEGLARVKYRNNEASFLRYEFIDKSGKKAFAKAFNDARDFHCGRAIVSAPGHRGLYGVINQKGKLIVNYKYKSISNFVHGLAVVEKFGLFGIINIDGEEIVPCQYSKISILDNNLIRVKNKDNLYGLLDYKGSVIIPCQYSSIEPFQVNDTFNAIVKDNVGYFFINSNNERLNPDYYHSVIMQQKQTDKNYADSLFVIYKEFGENILAGIADKDGKEIIPAYNYEAMTNEWGIYIKKILDKASLFNKEGKELLPLESVDFNMFSDGLAAVKNKEGLWGFIDPTGKLIIDYQYKEVSGFYKGYSYASRKKSNGELKHLIIDKQGNEKVLPYEVIPHFDVICLEGLDPETHESTNSLDFWDYKGNLLFSVGNVYSSLIQLKDKAIYIEADSEQELCRKKEAVIKKIRDNITEIYRRKIEPLDLEAELVYDSDYTLSKRKKDEQ